MAPEDVAAGETSTRDVTPGRMTSAEMAAGGMTSSGTATRSVARGGRRRREGQHHRDRHPSLHVVPLWRILLLGLAGIKRPGASEGHAEADPWGHLPLAGEILRWTPAD